VKLNEKEMMMMMKSLNKKYKKSKILEEADKKKEKFEYHTCSF